MILHFNATEQAFLNAILYSSHGINELGNYNKCSSTNTNRYILIKIKFVPNIPSFGNLTLCCPIECTTEHYNVLKPGIFAIMGQLFEAMNVSMQTLSFDIGVQSGTVIAYLIIRTPIDENLNVLNGARFSMMCWIILGHTSGDTFDGSVPNFQDFPNMLKTNYWLSFITSVHYAVDVFFTISVFLCGPSMTKTFSKKSHRNAKTVIQAIVGRFMRLVPLIGIAILTMLYIFPEIFKDPINNFWDDIRSQYMHFYSTLFLFNNYVKNSQTRCMDWAWFLSDDVQFFILTPIFTILYNALGQAAGLFAKLGFTLVSFI